MLPLLVKVRFSGTLGPSDQLLGEHRHPAPWRVACIQGPVPVCHRRALKNLRQLSPKWQAQLAPTHAFCASPRDWCRYRYLLGCCRGSQITHQSWHFPTAPSSDLGPLNGREHRTFGAVNGRDAALQSRRESNRRMARRRRDKARCSWRSEPSNSGSAAQRDSTSSPLSGIESIALGRTAGLRIRSMAVSRARDLMRSPTMLRVAAMISHIFRAKIHSVRNKPKIILADDLRR